MEFSKIIAISGKPGLFQVLAQSKGGVVVESLVDKQRFTAHSSYIISSFEDISIYSTDEDYPLKDVLKRIVKKTKGAKCVDHKAKDAELKKFMIELLPDYDQERVYTSDIKKLVKWFNILHEAKVLDEILAEEEKEEVEAATEEASTEKKAAKKTTAKKTAKKAPVKKAVAKKAPAMKAPAKQGAARGK